MLAKSDLIKRRWCLVFGGTRKESGIMKCCRLIKQFAWPFTANNQQDYRKPTGTGRVSVPLCQCRITNIFRSWSCLEAGSSSLTSAVWVDELASSILPSDECISWLSTCFGFGLKWRCWSNRSRRSQGYAWRGRMPNGRIGNFLWSVIRNSGKRILVLTFLCKELEERLPYPK